MIAGHFGLAAAVKSQEQQVPLWALMLATAWLDVLFVPLFLAGIERIEPVPGTSGGYGNGIIYADYTHSLIGAAVIAELFGLVAALPWGRRDGVVLGAVVFSHWLLDLVVHRGDMPIQPGDLGDLPRLGFGLWQVPAASAALELALVVGGAYLYWRAAVEAARGAGDARAGRAHLLGGLLLAAGVVTLGLARELTMPGERPRPRDMFGTTVSHFWASNTRSMNRKASPIGSAMPATRHGRGVCRRRGPGART